MNRKVLWRIIIPIWCAVIFVHSSMPADVSSKESMFVVVLLDRFIGSVFGPDKLLISEFLVRKAAHFTEYMILGALLFNGLRNKLLRTFGLSLLSGAAYAVTDEIHQHFVPGRVMSPYDVMIDSLGVLVGVSVLYLLARRRQLSAKYF